MVLAASGSSFIPSSGTVLTSGSSTVASSSPSTESDSPALTNPVVERKALVRHFFYATSKERTCPSSNT